MSRLSTILLPLAIAAASQLAMAQPQQCRVLDPELQVSYAGGCRNGLAEGYGEAAGTAQYRGEFRAGRKHGKGVMTWASGDRYEGDFVEDRREGAGSYAWGPLSAWAGETYSGGWRNDRRHGHGVYEWPGGDRYAGPWEDDHITGPATPRMLARARAYAEHAAAVGKRGARVCRDFAVGIAIRDRVRGTVTAVEADRITVRIDDPGRHPHLLRNTLITKGIAVQDLIASWTPCR